MNILIAPDSFKGSLTAVQAAGIIREALLADDPAVRCIMLPQADGGEGSIDAVWRAGGGELITEQLPDLVGEPRPVQWLLRDDGSALIEAATAIGWQLPEGVAREPRRFSTASFGLLLRAAAERAVRIDAAIGGSATSDCGMGFAEALGARFRTATGADADIPSRLAGLRRIEYSMPDLPPVRALADVRNPLLGPDGAVRVYGPQKGIPSEDLAEWDAAFEHCAAVVRRDVRDVDPAVEGMGAAGGLGFALSAFAGAGLRNGADALRALTGFDEHLAGADLVLTGEGRIDAQTLQGKVVQGIAKIAAGRGVPVAAFCGAVHGDVSVLAAALGVQSILSLSVPGEDTALVMTEAEHRLYTAVRNFMRTLRG
ncbi:MAG: glycerate kinase [Bacteroidia bacterium]|nr:glycerate kinase [Bacteroidia bacterium]